MDAGGINFELRGVGNELKEHLLAVPIYQRSYAWTEEEIAEFWGDLHSAFVVDAPEYFLGTIVLTRQGPEGRFTIIDGQQRLATASLLLAAIRDEYIKRNDQPRATIVQNTYLSTQDLATALDVARLSLNSEDSNFFEQRIVQQKDVPPPSKPSHALLLGAYDYLRNEISNAAGDAGVGWNARVLKWVTFVTERVKAIVLTVPTDSDAFLIFETLNDRGADLTIADLLKNYLFGHAGAEKLDVVRDGWMQVLGGLEISAENALFTTFLRHYWSSRLGAIRERELYRSIKERLTTSPQVVEFINDLQTASVLYSALLHSDHETWENYGGNAKETVGNLLRLDLEQNRPLLLAALQHFTKDEMKKVLRAIVSWSVRGIIVGGIGGGTAEKNYCRAAVKIRKGEIKTTAELLIEISAIVPSDDEFTNALAIARLPKAAFARYVLLALERGSHNQVEPELVPNANEEEVNLEHILPKRALEKDWGNDFTAEERANYVYRLGNLALLSKGPNGKIGNKGYDKKQPILAASALELTKTAAMAPAWTKDAIAERQKKLALLAVKVWPR